MDAITAVNNYVDAFNQNAADVAAQAGPAIDALNHSADLVARSMSDALTPELRDALNAWVDAARGVATAIAGNYGPDEFNVAITRLNDSKIDRAESVRRLILTNLTARRQLSRGGVRR